MRHLTRLYPKRWRERSVAEIVTFIERQRIRVRGVIHLLRGALDAPLHPELVARLVFVPAIGFRPGETRTLFEPATAIEDDTHLMVLAIAAAPDRTDVQVEWQRTGNPVTCPPGSHMLSASPGASLHPAVSAALVVGTSRLDAIAPMLRSAFTSSLREIRATQTMTFPPLPQVASTAELVVRDGEHEWRVPFTLVPGRVTATPLAVEARHDGIVVRASALARHGDDVIVAVEAEAAQQIHFVGAPVRAPISWSGREEEYAARVAEHRRVFGHRARPIVLEDDRGGRVEEHRRLFGHEPQRSTSGQPYRQRFSVMFASPSAEARRVTLVVPFVELIDRAPCVTADLRDLPLDITFGDHRFRIISAAAQGPSERRIVVEIPRSSSPQFIQPSRVQGLPSQPGYHWSGPDEEPFWMATAVGDPPIVTFEGAVVRVDGPWRLPLPLA